MANSFFSPPPPTVVFGIVGGIGSGKSFTSNEFVAQGVECFSADIVAKTFYRQPDIRAMFKQRWVNVIDPNGELNPKAIARIVFAPTNEGSKELEFLNSVFRPRVLQEFRKWLEQKKIERKEFVILDAPLLFEAHWESVVDYVIFVEASYQTREKRVLARGWEKGELERREACQISLAIKKSRADFVVKADHDKSGMEQQVKTILQTVRKDRSSFFFRKNSAQ